MRAFQSNHRKREVTRRRKLHDELVNRVHSSPEILGIGGLSDDKILVKEMFPTNDRGSETGDLLLIWEPSSEVWEILVIEVTSSPFRTLGHEFLKLSKSITHFSSNWKKLFSNHDLSLPENHKLRIRGASISYAGKVPWGEPFVTLGKVHSKR